MRYNINTKEYWEERFSSGDWEEKGGQQQSKNFAKGQIKYIEIPSNFSGKILDFGCGLGDAMPIYKASFPSAKLIGIDISESAIKICKKKYGSIATFLQGDHHSAPIVDIIIASNVFEHLSNDIDIAKHLLTRSSELYIIVPYKEWPLYSEHINTYNKEYFSELGSYNWKVFYCKGWSQYGLKLFYQIYFKNILRPFFKKERKLRKRQIIYKFKNNYTRR